LVAVVSAAAQTIEKPIGTRHKKGRPLGDHVSGVRPKSDVLARVFVFFPISSPIPLILLQN
jgi:hypothetical protein